MSSNGKGISTDVDRMSMVFFDHLSGFGPDISNCPKLYSLQGDQCGRHRGSFSVDTNKLDPRSLENRMSLGSRTPVRTLAMATVDEAGCFDFFDLMSRLGHHAMFPESPKDGSSAKVLKRGKGKHTESEAMHKSVHKHERAGSVNTGLLIEYYR